MRSISTAIEQLKSGKPVVMIDDASANHSGYIVHASALITEDAVTFMINHARGIICAAIDEMHLREIELDPMTSHQLPATPQMTVSVEAREGVTTGISAADRAHTLQILARTTSAKRDLVSPGHIFPVIARQGGVLLNSGIAEAAVDLLKLAEINPIATFCHCLDERGELANKKVVLMLADKFKLPIVSISEIISKRLISHSIVEKVSEAELPTRIAGSFRAHCFVANTDGSEHIALVKGEIDIKEGNGKQLPILVRVQAENKIGDLLGTKTLPQRKNLEAALNAIETAGRGVLVFVRHTKLGSVSASIAPANQQSSELRQHGIGAQILSHLGVKRITLLTNSTKDVTGVNAFGLEIVSRATLEY